MEKNNLYHKKIKKHWKSLSKKHNLKIDIKGIDPMPSFNFLSKKNLYYKTYVAQEFLKKEYWPPIQFIAALIIANI